MLVFGKWGKEINKEEIGRVTHRFHIFYTLLNYDIFSIFILFLPSQPNTLMKSHNSAREDLW